MYLALDVHYRENTAKAVGVGFSFPSEKIETTVIEYLDEVEEYLPGQFYKRELPCLIKVLEKLDLSLIEAIIIDGHIFVDNAGELGLGGKLWEAIDKKIPVIGVAKSAFESNKAIVRGVFRGGSKNPFYVSGIGITVERSVDIIMNMKGRHRMPDLLKWVDTLSKQT